MKIPLNPPPSSPRHARRKQAAAGAQASATAGVSHKVIAKNGALRQWAVAKRISDGESFSYQMGEHNQDLRDAIMREYLKAGSWTKRDEDAHGRGCSISNVRMKVRELPPGLLDTPASRSLFRAASHAIRIPYFGAYTPAEFRDCIYQVLMQHSERRLG